MRILKGDLGHLCIANKYDSVNLNDIHNEAYCTNIFYSTKINKYTTVFFLTYKIN